MRGNGCLIFRSQSGVALPMAIDNGRMYRWTEEIDDVEKRIPGIRGLNINIETTVSGRTHRYCVQSSCRSSNSSLSSADVFICSVQFELTVLG